MRHHHHHRSFAVAVHCLAACSFGLAACSAGLVAPAALPTSGAPGPASPAPLAPAAASSIAPAIPAVPTAIPAVPTAAAPPGAGEPTAVPASLIPASPIDSTTVLTPGGPWTRVDGAPGIATAGLFYEMSSRVWVYLPVAEDIPNGILWTLRDDTLPIIEAYLRAQAVRLRPGANVVLRPQVLGDDRTEVTALVADCVASVDDAATRTGWGAVLERRGSDWVVVSSGPREDACWFG